MDWNFVNKYKIGTSFKEYERTKDYDKNFEKLLKEEE